MDSKDFIHLRKKLNKTQKQMAQLLGITYPTVRSRLDQIIEDLKVELKRRDAYKKEILEKVEQGKLTAEKAAEMIKNL